MPFYVYTDQCKKMDVPPGAIHPGYIYSVTPSVPPDMQTGFGDDSSLQLAVRVALTVCVSWKISRRGIERFPK